MEKRKTDWGKIASILCVILLALNVWQLRRISELEQAVWNVQNSVVNQVSQVSSQVSSLRYDMDHAEDQVQDWNYTTAVHRETKSFGVEVSVTLKEWQADTAAELLWTNENGIGGEASVPLTGNGTGTFTGTLELPLTQLSGECGLDVKITGGETMRRESLGHLGGLAGQLPVQSGSRSYSGPEYTRDKSGGGTLKVTDCDIDLSGPEGAPLPDLSDSVFRLRRNGEIAAEETAVYGETIDRYTCEELSSEARMGDEFTLTFFCRDESGLGYEFFLNGWTIDENGIRGETTPETDWPRLAWD